MSNFLATIKAASTRKTGPQHFDIEHVATAGSAHFGIFQNARDEFQVIKYTTNKAGVSKAVPLCYGFDEDADQARILAHVAKFNAESEAGGGYTISSPALEAYLAPIREAMRAAADQAPAEVVAQEQTQEEAPKAIAEMSRDEQKEEAHRQALKRLKVLNFCGNLYVVDTSDNRKVEYIPVGDGEAARQRRAKTLARDIYQQMLEQEEREAEAANAAARAKRLEAEEDARIEAEAEAYWAEREARTEAKRAAMLSNYTAQDAAALSDAIEAERVETFKATLQGAPAAVGKYGHMAHKEARAASIPAYWFLLDERQQEVCEVYLEMIQRHTEEAMKEPGDSRRLKQRKDAHTAGLRSALKCYELHLLEVYEALGDQ